MISSVTSSTLEYFILKRYPISAAISRRISQVSIPDGQGWRG